MNLIHFVPDYKYTLHKCSLSDDLVEYDQNCLSQNNRETHSVASDY